MKAPLMGLFELILWPSQA